MTSEVFSSTVRSQPSLGWGVAPWARSVACSLEELCVVGSCRSGPEWFIGSRYLIVAYNS
jgi:hypothetical protein